MKALEERVHGLEEQLVGQINSLTTSKNVAYHGPDTVDHFNDFTMAKLLEEFELLSPDVLRLLRILGNTGRRDNEDDEEVDPTSDTMVVMAMCALLKSRTRKPGSWTSTFDQLHASGSVNKQSGRYLYKINEKYSNYESCWDMCVICNHMEVPKTTD